MLTFKRSDQRLCRIKGGKNNGRVVFIKDVNPREEVKTEKIEDPFKVLGKEFFETKATKLTKAEEKLLKKALINRELGESKEEKKIKKKFKKGLDAITSLERQSGDIELPINEEMIPIPKEGSEPHHSITISGKAGSGKSTMGMIFTKEILRRKPTAQVFLFSQKPEDVEMDSIPDLNRILIDDTFGEAKIDWNEFPEDSIVIFDDIDLLPKEQKDPVMFLRGKLMFLSRSKRIIIINLVHSFFQWAFTKQIIAEGTDFVFFLKHGATKEIIDFLKTHMRFSKSEIEKVLKLRTRWVWLRTGTPSVVIHQGGAYLRD